MLKNGIRDFKYFIVSIIGIPGFTTIAFRWILYITGIYNAGSSRLFNTLQYLLEEALERQTLGNILRWAVVENPPSHLR